MSDMSISLPEPFGINRQIYFFPLLLPRIQTEIGAFYINFLNDFFSENMIKGTVSQRYWVILGFGEFILAKTKGFQFSPPPSKYYEFVTDYLLYRSQF